MSGTVNRLLRKRNVFVFASVVMFLLQVVFCSTPAVGQAKRNLQIMEMLLRESVIPLLDSLAVPKSAPLIVQIMPRGHETSWFVQTRVLRDLTEAGYREVLVGDDAARPGNRLTLRADGLEVSYRKLDSPADTLRRQIVVKISGLLLSNDGRVVWSGLMEKAHADTVAASDVARLEESPYEFTYGEGSRGSRPLSRVLESVGLAAMLGLITYLFYSYRTR